MLAELAKLVQSRAVPAVELVRRAYERVGSLNGGLNAVVALRDEEEAVAEAQGLDERARRGERLGPLAGVPFLVKDAQDLAGLRTTQGSLLLAEAPPARRDALSVARLRAAGAIPIGKSNVPEYCFEGYTDNLLFGATRNPWAPEWSPGGSSGGGSVRIPASFCGLFGLKPTNGLVGRDPIPPWIDYSTDGPLALSMADLRLLLAIQAGPVRGDPTALPGELAARLVGPDAAASAAAAAPRRPSLVLAAPRFVEWGPLPNAVADQFDAALTSLEKDLGLPVEPIAPAEILGDGDGAANADEDWLLTCACEQANAMGREAIEAGAERFHPAFLAAMRHGLAVNVEDYLAARRRRFAYVRALDELLGSDRVLVTPTTPQQGFYADGREVGAKRPGTGVSSYNTQVQNMTGHPALSVPAGRSPNGVPFGLQITGPRFADALVMDIGEAWERAHPGERVAPGFESFLPAG